MECFSNWPRCQAVHLISDYPPSMIVHQQTIDVMLQRSQDTHMKCCFNDGINAENFICSKLFREKKKDFHDDRPDSNVSCWLQLFCAPLGEKTLIFTHFSFSKDLKTSTYLILMMISPTVSFSFSPNKSYIQRNNYIALHLTFIFSQDTEVHKCKR